MIKIIQSDSLEILPTLETDSIDSCVTDPPYELEFMGKKWDSTGIAYNVDLWREVFRVLKPGAFLLAFGGTRTCHRMVCAIEDAGFEIRDQMQWLYGQGFAKALNISYEFENRLCDYIEYKPKMRAWFYKDDGIKRADKPPFRDDDANNWIGFHTALKPANEPICVARKPLSEKTVAANVLKHGCGGINIDAGRIGTEESWDSNNLPNAEDGVVWGGNLNKQTSASHSLGRWPANVILDEEAAEMLDRQSGVSKSMPRTQSPSHHSGEVTTFQRGSETSQHHDSGGASRFFYTAKAHKREREAGLEEMVLIQEKESKCQEENTVAVQLLKRAMSGSITSLNIVESGDGITAMFPSDCLSTILTETSRIIDLKILSLLIRSLTNESTPGVINSTENGSNHVVNVESLKTWILNTTNGSTELALGASHVALRMLLKIREGEKHSSSRGNIHSTVKPIDLMEYLIKLVTQKGGVVLDPFAGSGTTGVACARLGFSFTGIELNEEYAKIAESRLKHFSFEDFKLA